MHSYNKMDIFLTNNSSQSVQYWYLKQGNFIDINGV